MKKLQSAVLQALDDNPVEDVLAVLLGNVVALALEVGQRQGHDMKKEIRINGGKCRDITIHAPKP